MNKLYYGDNLPILREHIADGSVNLVYLDPPFNSNATYNVLFKAPSGEGSRAQMLDSLDDVEFWIRNVSQHVNSFWLPLAAGKFYPDFVAMLKDGRTFVVEYKGGPFADPGVDDTNEKRTIGAKWERQSGGKGLFLVVEKEVSGRGPREQMLDKLH